MGQGGNVDHAWSNYRPGLVFLLSSTATEGGNVDHAGAIIDPGLLVPGSSSCLLALSNGFRPTSVPERQYAKTIGKHTGMATVKRIGMTIGKHAGMTMVRKVGM